MEYNYLCLRSKDDNEFRSSNFDDMMHFHALLESELYNNLIMKYAIAFAAGGIAYKAYDMAQPYLKPARNYEGHAFEH